LEPGEKLAWNHAIGSMRKHGVGFFPGDKSATSAYKALGGAVHLLCPILHTIASRSKSLPETLDMLDLFYMPASLDATCYKGLDVAAVRCDIVCWRGRMRLMHQVTIVT
jgi:hypothetical protein